MIIIGFVGGGILLCVIVGIILSALMDAKDIQEKMKLCMVEEG